jgi:hypothetical protein
MTAANVFPSLVDLSVILHSRLLGLSESRALASLWN